VAAVLLAACVPPQTTPSSADAPFVVVLGTAQDGGFPQAGTKPGPEWNEERRYAASLAIVDPASGARWLIEATPDFREQLHELDRIAPVNGVPGLAGIFVTHAHVGHYTGLMHLGREIIGARDVPVYAMPRLHAFLSSNGPWDQLVRLNNIALHPLTDGVATRLNERISITPFLVPHRDEYSETVGFRITGPTHTIVFLPDIDKWERWSTPIESVVTDADVAYLDGTFYADGEVPGRAMSEIPHPFIMETMQRFAALPAAVKRKVRFIHLNRTNPVAIPEARERTAVEAAGFGVARWLERVPL
jgi:pyrroloquinoline quinone biosynthesis protein B